MLNGWTSFEIVLYRPNSFLSCVVYLNLIILTNFSHFLGP